MAQTYTRVNLRLLDNNKTTSLYILQFVVNIIHKYFRTTTTKRPYVLSAKNLLFFILFYIILFVAAHVDISRPPVSSAMLLSF
jgi:hypothetical protein